MIAVFRTIWWFIFFFGSLVCLIPSMNKANRLKAEGRIEEARAIVHPKVIWWATSLMKITGVTITVNGRENIPTGRAVMFTPNHQSNYDIPLMLTQLDAPPALVAKVETDKIPLVRTWMRLLDCVFLDRDNPRAAATAMNEAAALLQQGRSVVVFPEGTRSKGEALGEFKAGAFRMATKANAPIVPVVIDGSYKLMEANHNLMCPGHVTITILPAIETAGMDKAAQRALPQQVAEAIAAVKNNKSEG